MAVKFKEFTFDEEGVWIVKSIRFEILKPPVAGALATGAGRAPQVQGCRLALTWRLEVPGSLEGLLGHKGSLEAPGTGT